MLGATELVGKESRAGPNFGKHVADGAALFGLQDIARSHRCNDPIARKRGGAQAGHAMHERAGSLFHRRTSDFFDLRAVLPVAPRAGPVLSSIM